MPHRSAGEKRHVLPLRWKRAVVVCAGVFAIATSVNAGVLVLYRGRMLPNVRIGNVPVGGKTVADAIETMKKPMDELENVGIPLSYDGASAPFGFTLADPEGIGLAKNLLDYDADATAHAMEKLGNSGSFLPDVADRFRAVLGGIRITPAYVLGGRDLEAALAQAIGKHEQPVVEPGFSVSSSGGVSVEPGKEGDVFDYAAIARELAGRVRSLSTDAVAISLERVSPSVTDAEATGVLGEAEKIAKTGPVALRAGDETVTVKPGTYVRWLAPRRDGTKVSVTISDEALRSYLKSILPQVNVPPKDARYRMEDGKVKQIQSGSTGTELDVEDAVRSISAGLLKDSDTIALTMRTVESQATAAAIGNLGITELVGTATTKFTGSPANRRHNIKVGADLLNGLLIKPGEEFSLIKMVGPVDGTKGYLQELVIKGDKTIPEYGGGLCQIGTTMFRVVMNAGLPILERQNHSYRVSYYEPPVGMDATIYEPKPDFRFKNDYPGYLLLQTQVNGDNLTFELYGTKDGRTAVTTTPKVFNVVAPPPQLTIETTDLPPKATKCTERAHVGSDAEFSYTVTSADGTKETQTFKSHYRPWRAVCFVGVKKLTTKKPTEPTNSNSNANADTNANTNTGTNVNENTNTALDTNVTVNAAP